MPRQSLSARAREAVERAIADAARKRKGAIVLPYPDLSPLPDDLPVGVRKAINYYDTELEGFDLFRYLCRLPSAAGELFLLMHGFEDTDGVVEVFAPNGKLLGAAQFIGERVGWDDVKVVRACLQNGHRVSALEAGVQWVEQQDGGYQSTCGRYKVFRIQANCWRLVMNGEHIQDWDTWTNARAHAEALALPAE